MKRKYLLIILLPLLLCSFLSVGYAQLSVDTSIISMSGSDWSLKVDSALASSIDSRNTPYMTAKSSTEKELFLELATLEDCKSGVVQFKVDMQGLTAYKQLPLDLELDVKEYEFVNDTHAINNSKVVVYRPENIVNSFALFDDSGRKQAHISASKLVASDGSTVWCDSNLEGGLLTVVLPLEWLESAKFPVVLDPTFGYEDVGVSDGYNGANAVVGSYFELTEDAYSINYASFYAGTWGSTQGKVCIWYVNGTLIYTSNAVGFVAVAGWSNTSFAPNYGLSAGVYAVGYVISDGDSAQLYDTGGTDDGFIQTDNNFTIPTTLSATNNTRLYSVYVNYTSMPEVTPSPSPSYTPFPEGDMSNTDWWISILVLLLIIINIFLMMLPFALVRFTFGILSLFLCMLALSYAIPLSPYLQTAGLLISALAMLFSVRARE